MFSGNPLMVLCLAPAILRVVNYILRSCISGMVPYYIAAFAFSLVSFRSSFSLLNRSYKIVAVFPSLFNALINP